MKESQEGLLPSYRLVIGQQTNGMSLINCSSICLEQRDVESRAAGHVPQQEALCNRYKENALICFHGMVQATANLQALDGGVPGKDCSSTNSCLHVGVNPVLIYYYREGICL